METVGHDDVVIYGDHERENDHGNANPHGAGQHLTPDGERTSLSSILDEH